MKIRKISRTSIEILREIFPKFKFSKYNGRIKGRYGKFTIFYLNALRVRVPPIMHFIVSYDENKILTTNVFTESSSVLTSQAKNLRTKLNRICKSFHNALVVPITPPVKNGWKCEKFGTRMKAEDFSDGDENWNYYKNNVIVGSVCKFDNDTCWSAYDEVDAGIGDSWQYEFEEAKKVVLKHVHDKYRSK